MLMNVIPGIISAVTMQDVTTHQDRICVNVMKATVAMEQTVHVGFKALNILMLYMSTFFVAFVFRSIQ